jgi:hypothetical protein
MAEPEEYRVNAKVEMVGYDTVRYAVVSADTSVAFRVTTDGYRAFLFSMRHEEPELKIQVEGDVLQYSVAVESLYEILRGQMGGVKNVAGAVDSVRMTLAERHHRVYRPSLDRVDFSFAEQYGLYGQPTVSPAEVTLYGPEEALAAIDEVRVAPSSVTDIKASGSYRLPLEPVWKQYPDVHPSSSEVSVYIPVEAFVEREYHVPVTVSGADTNVELRIYPEEVTLRVWVAQRDLARTPDFEVVIDYGEVLQHKSTIQPRLQSYPSYIRPRSIEPGEVQCVIIK